MVGSALVRKLQSEGYDNLVLRTRAELDLLRQSEVQRFFDQEKPDSVFLAAARVGGILANSASPAQFIYENLQIQTNVIHGAFRAGMNRLLFLGSSCIYPKFASQPITEDSLLSGKLEPTNESYAVAKIAGVAMCEAYNQQYGTRFITAMPCNLYGPNDNFDLNTAHVLPALMRKLHAAKVQQLASVEIWGTGRPMREFLHVDDLADACLFLVRNYSESKLINVGFGEDIAIAELAGLISEVVGFEGELVFNSDMPDGTPRKLLDVSKLNALGWKPRHALRDGIEETYAWYLSHHQA